MLRSIVMRLVLAGAIIVVVAMLVEYGLEVRDRARYTADQTFATVGDSRIRYKLEGSGHPGATVVILSGLRGTIEQSAELQAALSRTVPSLSYDRAGYGFSEGSTAHGAWDQATELAALLKALDIKGPVVLVPYSRSADVARIFAGRYPELTAGLYMIEPSMPGVEKMVPPWHSAVRSYLRPTIRDLVASSIGLIRLKQRLANWQGPESLVEQRAEAILASRAHYWALAKEWILMNESDQQALNAPVPDKLPIWVAHAEHVPEDEVTKVLGRLYGEFVARSSRGKLIELQAVDHSNLVKSGPALDRMVEGIVELSQGNAH